jgi:hypothetical protein
VLGGGVGLGVGTEPGHVPASSVSVWVDILVTRARKKRTGFWVCSEDGKGLKKRAKTVKRQAMAVGGCGGHTLSPLTAAVPPHIYLHSCPDSPLGCRAPFTLSGVKRAQAPKGWTITEDYQTLEHVRHETGPNPRTALLPPQGMRHRKRRAWLAGHISPDVGY